VKLAWRRSGSRNVSASAGRGLTGPERAAALGVPDPDDDDDALDAVPAAPAPAGPVMLTLTTRSQIEQAEQEGAAARPVRRRMERGAMGGRVSPGGSGGGCGSGACG
jgi:hypothetical protein